MGTLTSFWDHSEKQPDEFDGWDAATDFINCPLHHDAGTNDEEVAEIARSLLRQVRRDVMRTALQKRGLHVALLAMDTRVTRMVNGNEGDTLVINEEATELADLLAQEKAARTAELDMALHQIGASPSVLCSVALALHDDILFDEDGEPDDFGIMSDDYGYSSDGEDGGTARDLYLRFVNFGHNESTDEEQHARRKTTGDIAIAIARAARLQDLTDTLEHDRRLPFACPDDNSRWARRDPIFEDFLSGNSLTISAAFVDSICTRVDLSVAREDFFTGHGHASSYYDDHDYNCDDPMDEYYAEGYGSG